MKKDKYYLNKIFLINLAKLLFIQSLFIIVVFYYGAGGDGTYLPLALCYGIFSILFFINSNPFTFFLAPIGFFLINIYSLQTKSNNNFIKLLFFHITGVVAVLFLALPENITLEIQIESIATSSVICFLFWFLFYLTLENKGQK